MSPPTQLRAPEVLRPPLAAAAVAATAAVVWSRSAWIAAGSSSRSTPHLSASARTRAPATVSLRASPPLSLA